MSSLRKENNSDSSPPILPSSFSEPIQDAKSLLQKELDVNRAEQILLQKRIDLMTSFINEIPSSDPNYHILLVQVQMDQIEMHELKVRETLLIQKISLS